MDIKEYIQSGIIEQYVLGLATTEEVAEVEQLRNQYPELQDAILRVEESFESYFVENKFEPPAHLKASIEKELFGDKKQAVIVDDGFKPEIEKKTAFGLWRYIAAASIVLLIVSTALNFYFYSGYRNSKAQYQALLVERNTLQANNASYKETLQLLQDTSMVHIKMDGTPGKQENLATVLWDKYSKDVYLNTENMQKTPSGKQYQLWAIVDGKPVDAGLVFADCSGFCKMSVKIDHAEAFAITLEKEGGSATPTLSEMYVLGKIKT